MFSTGWERYRVLKISPFIIASDKKKIATAGGDETSTESQEYVGSVGRRPANYKTDAHTSSSWA
jgi:hypothetical protein